MSEAHFRLNPCEPCFDCCHKVVVLIDFRRAPHATDLHIGRDASRALRISSEVIIAEPLDFLAPSEYAYVLAVEQKVEQGSHETRTQCQNRLKFWPELRSPSVIPAAGPPPEAFRKFLLLSVPEPGGRRQ